MATLNGARRSDRLTGGGRGVSAAALQQRRKRSSDAATREQQEAFVGARDSGRSRQRGESVAARQRLEVEEFHRGRLKYARACPRQDKHEATWR